MVAIRNSSFSTVTLSDPAWKPRAMQAAQIHSAEVLDPRAAKGCGPQHMPGRAADAILLDGGGKFKAQAHGLGDLCLPAKLVALDLAVRDGNVVFGVR